LPSFLLQFLEKYPPKHSGLSRSRFPRQPVPTEFPRLFHFRGRGTGGTDRPVGGAPNMTVNNSAAVSAIRAQG
jgi:hypothetical protein